jgi:hypothetical protein
MPKSRTLPTSADFVLAVADEAAADRAEEHPELRCGKRQGEVCLGQFPVAQNIRQGNPSA